MIEIDHLSHEGRDCVVRLRCACGAPRLSLYPCADGQVFFCHHCGELASGDRLLNHTDFPLSSTHLIWLNVTNHGAQPPAEVSLPVAAEFASPVIGAGRFTFSAFITRLSSEEGLLRLDAATQARRVDGCRRIHLKSREIPFNAETVGYVEEVTRPQGPEGAVFYQLRLSLASAEQRAQIELLTRTPGAIPYAGGILLLTDPTRVNGLEDALRQCLPECRIDIARDAVDGVKIMADSKPEILVIPSDPECIRQLKQAQAGHDGSGRAVFARLEHETVEAVGRALQGGADEVLPHDFTPQDLIRAIGCWQSRLAQTPESSSTTEPDGGPRSCAITRPGKVLPVIEEDVIRMLCMASETHDANSANHLNRMSAYSAAITRQLQWPSWRVARLATASKLHDVGKLGVPDGIMRKTGALTAEERKTMQEHTRFGYQILNMSTSDLMQLGAVVALRHHERYDGTGYPDALAGNAIPVEAQIVSISDVFDALTTARAYKPAWSNDKAIAYIREQSGRMFNPLMVEAFLHVLPEIETIQHQFQDDLRNLWAERRKFRRYPAAPIPIDLEVALPEQTFRPYPLNGFLREISQGGLRLSLNNVSLDLFTLLISTRRYARLVCLDPAWHGLHQAFCNVIWLDYYAVPDPNGCLMGLSFQKTNPELNDKIEGLAQQYA